MPKRGYVAITIDESVYELAREIYKKNERYLKARGIKSVASLVEYAIHEIAKSEYPHTYKEWLEKLKKEREEEKK